MITFLKKTLDFFFKIHAEAGMGTHAYIPITQQTEARRSRAQTKLHKVKANLSIEIKSIWKICNGYDV